MLMRIKDSYGLTRKLKSRTQGPALLFKKVHFYYKDFKPLPNIHAR